MRRERPLHHWTAVSGLMAAIVAPAEDFFAGKRRCVSRLTWGLGPKPFFNAFLVNATRTAVRFIRGLLSPRVLALPPMPSTASTITIRRTGAGRSLADYSRLEALFRIDAHCCDFSAPLFEQLKLISQAGVVIGVHGAGLTNVLFVRERPVLIELKGSYAITAFEYRKYTQCVYGGFAAVSINDDGAMSISELQAQVVHACIVALERSEVDQCRQLPYVMQASAVGHGDDCWVREWFTEGRRPPPEHSGNLCPTPSWREVRHGSCWYVHAHARLTPRAAANATQAVAATSPPEQPLRGRQSRMSTRLARANTEPPVDCTLRFAELQAALDACAQSSWCGGVTSLDTRRVSSACRRHELHSSRLLRYELRQLPLEEYLGMWRGQYSWVRMRPADCAAPPPRLLSTSAVDGTSLKPPLKASDATVHQPALRASFNKGRSSESSRATHPSGSSAHAWPAEGGRGGRGRRREHAGGVAHRRPVATNSRGAAHRSVGAARLHTPGAHAAEHAAGRRVGWPREAGRWRAGRGGADSRPERVSGPRRRTAGATAWSPPQGNTRGGASTLGGTGWSFKPSSSSSSSI